MPATPVASSASAACSASRGATDRSGSPRRWSRRSPTASAASGLGSRRFRTATTGRIDWLEGDGWEERPIRLEVTVRVRGADVEVDWEGTAPQVRGGINMSLPTTSGVGVYAIRAALDPAVPANAGMFAPVRTIAPSSSVVNPSPPAPSQTGVSETAQRAADLLMMALSQAVPGQVVAGTYASAAMTVIEGPDLADWRRRALGRERTTVMELSPGGSGARATKDGVSGIKVHTGNTRTQPVEIVEFVAPVRMLSWRRVPDSGGPGRQRGGCSVEKVFRTLAPGVHFTSVVERTTVLPFGLLGGRPGGPGRLARDPGGPAEQVMPSKHPPVRTRGGRALPPPPRRSGRLRAGVGQGRRGRRRRRPRRVRQPGGSFARLRRRPPGRLHGRRGRNRDRPGRTRSGTVANRGGCVGSGSLGLPRPVLAAGGAVSRCGPRLRGSGSSRPSAHGSGRRPRPAPGQARRAPARAARS